MPESPNHGFIRNAEGSMTSLEIKFLAVKKWGTITAAARELHCSRAQLSNCILGKRITPEILPAASHAGVCGPLYIGWPNAGPFSSANIVVEQARDSL